MAKFTEDRGIKFMATTWEFLHLCFVLTKHHAQALPFIFLWSHSTQAHSTVSTAPTD